MREDKDIKFRVRAFRKALELSAQERSEECRHLSRWKPDLHNFPRGSCDMTSNCLARYLSEKKVGIPSLFLWMAVAWKTRLFTPM